MLRALAMLLLLAPARPALAGLEGQLEQYALVEAEGGMPRMESEGLSPMECQSVHRGIRLLSGKVLDCTVPWDGLADLQLKGRGRMLGAVVQTQGERAAFVVAVPVEALGRRQAQALVFVFGRQDGRQRGAVFSLAAPPERLGFTSPRGLRAPKGEWDVAWVEAGGRTHYLGLEGWAEARALGWEAVKQQAGRRLTQGLHLPGKIGFAYWGEPLPWDDPAAIRAAGGQAAKATASALGLVAERLREF